MRCQHAWNVVCRHDHKAAYGSTLTMAAAAADTFALHPAGCMRHRPAAAAPKRLPPVPDYTMWCSTLEWFAATAASGSMAMTAVMAFKTRVRALHVCCPQGLVLTRSDGPIVSAVSPCSCPMMATPPKPSGSSSAHSCPITPAVCLHITSGCEKSHERTFTACQGSPCITSAMPAPVIPWDMPQRHVFMISVLLLSRCSLAVAAESHTYIISCCWCRGTVLMSLCINGRLLRCLRSVCCLTGCLPRDVI
jgi:hypothetical protein